MITTPFYEFKNSLTTENKFQSLISFMNSYQYIRENNYFKVHEIDLKEIKKWNINNKEIVHESGKFFKIEGIKVHTNYGNKHDWDQPIINQHEIGILGIITKVRNGVRYFLMQLKMEPGNINLLQLSPTVQATKSNFLQVHKGKSTLYLEYFAENKKSKILIDQLQSEQGGRFLRKRNRNMIVEIYDEFVIPENFFWLTLGEIKNLLHLENFVNMDARSVLSTIPLDYDFGMPLYADQEVIRWFIDQKMKYELQIEKVSLSQLKDWHIAKNRIYNFYRADKFFTVIGIKVETKNREIFSWCQPMFKDENEGLIGLIMKKFKGDNHYLFQVKVLPGNIDIIDLSPTVSYSNYKQYIGYEDQLEFFDRFIYPKNSQILYDVKQSEEGGRFYHLQTRNMLIEIDDEIDIPDNYIWLNKDQINKFLPYGMFNVESRSLISII